MKKKLYVGSYVDCYQPNYLLTSIDQTVKNKANAMMFFDGSPRVYRKTDINKFKIAEFHDQLKKHNIKKENCFIHLSYIINLANLTNDIVVTKSYMSLEESLKRLEKIGIYKVVLHAGSTIIKNKEKEGILQLSKHLNQLLKNYPKTQLLIETMSGKGSQICYTFEQIKLLMDNLDKEVKDMVGVCWDTCHLWDAGYDFVNDLDKVIKAFDKIIGLNKLWLIHLNNSKTDFGAKKDRHQQLLNGKIPTKALLNLVFHKKIFNTPVILETPIENYYSEIQYIKKNNPYT